MKIRVLDKYGNEVLEETDVMSVEYSDNTLTAIIKGD